VQDYISSHFAAEITLQDLAAIAGVSASHFSREFKRCVGISPHQYIVVKRVERAAHLISTTQHCLNDIAMEVGFSDQSHFCRTFRHVLNMTPSEFRRTLPEGRAPRRGTVAPQPRL
jgi:AraC family transcriptional regulator